MLRLEHRVYRNTIKYLDFHKATFDIILFSPPWDHTFVWKSQKVRLGKDCRGLCRDLIVYHYLLLMLKVSWGQWKPLHFTFLCSPLISLSCVLPQCLQRESLTLACPPCFTGQHRTSYCHCRPGTLSLTALLLPSRLGVPCPCCSLHHPLDYLLPSTHWSQTKETTKLTYLGRSNISFLIRLTRVIITVSLSRV